MAIVTRYQSDPSLLTKIDQALRGGAARATAGRCAGIGLDTLERWIDKDPAVRRLVETAEAAARDGGVRPAALSPGRGPARTDADRWADMRREASVLGPGLYGVLLWIDGHLSARGWPPLSVWWRETLCNFYGSGKRWCVLLVGRRGGKSSTLCRVAVVEAIFGERDIPPGDVGVWPIFSVDMAEARGRLTTVCAILGALGVEYTESALQGRPRIVTTDARGKPIEFRVYPATVSGASGFTAPGVTCDEEAKWRDVESGANPAREVLKSVRPTMATVPSAHGFRCSSAWASSGTHYEAIVEGQTALTFVATIGAELEAVRASFYNVADHETDPGAAKAIRDHADRLTADSASVPSWLANPTLSPADTRADEPDLATWLREYASVPSGSEGGVFFDGAKLDAASSIAVESDMGACFAALDTGVKRNACALAIVRKVGAALSPIYVPVELREWIPAPGAPLDLRLVVLPEAAALCAAHGVREWRTDAFAGDQVELVGAAHGIRTRYTGPDPYAECYRPVRDGLNRGQIALHGCAEAVRQLRIVKSAYASGAHVRIIVPEEGDLHGDLGVALVRALGAAGCGAPDPIRASPISTVPGRYASCDPRFKRR